MNFEKKLSKFLFTLPQRSRPDRSGFIGSEENPGFVISLALVRPSDLVLPAKPQGGGVEAERWQVTVRTVNVSPRLVHGGQDGLWVWNRVSAE